jgi:hypothetical protein
MTSDGTGGEYLPEEIAVLLVSDAESRIHRDFMSV